MLPACSSVEAIQNPQTANASYRRPKCSTKCVPCMVLADATFSCHSPAHGSCFKPVWIAAYSISKPRRGLQSECM